MLRQNWLLVSFIALCFAPSAEAGLVQLTLDSEPGDWVGQGREWDITYQSPEDLIHVNISGAGAPAAVEFILDRRQTPENEFAILEFQAPQLTNPLTEGTYLDARREAGLPTGHPGLDVSFQNRGSNTLTGSFTVHDIKFGTSPTGDLQLLRFDAEFVQHSEGADPALFGRIQFSANVVPEPSSLALLATGALGLLRFTRRRIASR